MPTEHQSEFKSTSGLARIWRAFGYSLDGLKAAWAHEHAFRQELALLVVGSTVAFSAPITALERVLLIGMLVFVIVVELLNSAIEAVVDRVGLERHELSKRAKDIGSAAVLLSLLLSGAVWLVVLWPWWKSFL